MGKKLWNIYHGYDVDGGFGDAIPTCELVGTAKATEDEINRFVQKWDQPEVYDHPYADLCCHHVYAEEVKIVDMKKFKPYSMDPDDWFNQGIQREKEQTE